MDAAKWPTLAGDGGGGGDASCLRGREIQWEKIESETCGGYQMVMMEVGALFHNHDDGRIKKNLRGVRVERVRQHYL